MTTKWEKEIPIHYKELFENYKNIEMFQNIHNDNDNTSENFIEGFNFAGDDFNMHASRKKLFGSTSIGKDITYVFTSLRDFILCPFYNSDRIIDSGIKNLLKLFLMVKCTNVSLNSGNSDFSGKSKKDPSGNFIFDGTDLIDPDLLYTSESFQNKNQEGMNTMLKEDNKKCKYDQKQANIEVSKYTAYIKREIYNFIFLPLVLHMFYNCYYMLFHRDLDGTKPEFINIEKTFYEPNLKPYLSYFLDIAIKPVTWLYNILYFIANPANEKNGHPVFKPYLSFTEKYPYIVFILLFIIMYSIISQSQQDIISTWGKLLFRTSNSIDPFTGFAIAVMGIEFFKAFINEFKDWRENIKQQVFSGPIKFIIYWILRIVVNILLYSFAGYLCTVYLFVYLFFGVSVSNNKDTFEVFEDINDTIYTKMYKRFDNSCGQLDWWGFIVKYFFRFIFLFFIEIILLSLLMNGTNVYTAKVSNANILSFLLVLISSCMFVIGMICFMKYLTVLPVLDDKYQVVNVKL